MGALFCRVDTLDRTCASVLFRVTATGAAREEIIRETSDNITAPDIVPPVILDTPRSSNAPLLTIEMECLQMLSPT